MECIRVEKIIFSRVWLIIHNAVFFHAEPGRKIIVNFRRSRVPQFLTQVAVPSAVQICKNLYKNTRLFNCLEMRMLWWYYNKKFQALVHENWASRYSQNFLHAMRKIQSKFSQITQISHFCRKLTSRGFKSFQQTIKLPPVGIELTTDNYALV